MSGGTPKHNGRNEHQAGKDPRKDPQQALRVQLVGKTVQTLLLRFNDTRHVPRGHAGPRLIVVPSSQLVCMPRRGGYGDCARQLLSHRSYPEPRDALPWLSWLPLRQHRPGLCSGEIGS